MLGLPHKHLPVGIIKASSSSCIATTATHQTHSKSTWVVQTYPTSDYKTFEDAFEALMAEPIYRESPPESAALACAGAVTLSLVSPKTENVQPCMCRPSLPCLSHIHSGHSMNDFVQGYTVFLCTGSCVYFLKPYQTEGKHQVCY